MSSRPIIQVRWSDETEWKDYGAYNPYIKAEDQLDELRKAFAITKIKYGLKYDAEFRVGVTYAKP